MQSTWLSTIRWVIYSTCSRLVEKYWHESPFWVFEEIINIMQIIPIAAFQEGEWNQAQIALDYHLKMSHPAAQTANIRSEYWSCSNWTASLHEVLIGWSYSEKWDGMCLNVITLKKYLQEREKINNTSHINTGFLSNKSAEHLLSQDSQM